MRRTLAIAMLVALAAFALAGDDARRAVVPDREGRDALYAWLDEVGYPDGRTSYVVIVRDPNHHEEIAFVLGGPDEEGRTEVFSLADGGQTLAAAGSAADGRCIVRRTAFEAAVRERLHALAARLEPDDGPFHGIVWQQSGRMGLVLLARSAARRGLPELESALLDAASVEGGVLEWPDERTGKPLADLVRADAELYERILAWGNFDAGPDLAARRARLVRFATLFPKSDFAKAARSDAEVLARMIEEAPRIPSAEAVAALTGAARAEALVLRLRFQSAWCGAMGGVSLHMEGRGDSPLDRLIAMGDAALPALVGALSDTTLTQAVADGRVGTTPRSVTVGQAARDGLQAITGQWFADAAAARAWLDARGEAGSEAALLRDRVIDGTYVNEQNARRLIALDPQAALDVLVGALDAHPSVEIHVPVVALLGEIALPAAVDRLRAETAGDRPFAARQMAAQHLCDTAPEEGRALLLALWDEAPGPTPLHYPATAAAATAHEYETYAWERLAPWMVEQGAWDALTSGLAAKTPLVRGLVYRAMASKAPDVFAGAEPAPAEALLDTALEDDGDVPNGLFPTGLGNCPDARLADLVAGELSARFSGRFVFSGQAPREVRDAEIARIRNAVRARLGREPLDEPPLPAVAPRPDADVAALVAAFATDDLAARDGAERAVAAAGLPALPALRRALAIYDAAAPGRDALDRGVRRLACTVRDLIVRESADPATAAALTTHVGRPVDPSALTATLRDVLAAGTPLTLLVHRPADDTGCTLVVAPGPTSGGDRLDMRGAFSQSTARDLNENAWQSIQDELASAVASEPDAPWAIRLRLLP